MRLMRLCTTHSHSDVLFPQSMPRTNHRSLPVPNMHNQLLVCVTDGIAHPHYPAYGSATFAPHTAIAQPPTLLIRFTKRVERMIKFYQDPAALQ